MAEQTAKSGKKVVTVEKAEPSQKAKDLANDAVKNNTDGVWKPTAENKSKATTFRVVAVIFWVLAIAAEAVTIFWLLKQSEQSWFLWALIGAVVVIGILAVVGSQFWKKANQLDPAKKSEPTRFFIQNQLGVIISIIAFLPLIILIFLNKDMDGKQKGIAGGLAIVVLIAAGLLSADFSPNSVEDETAQQVANEGQIGDYTTIVTELTGENVVTWTKSGGVYHLCTDASAVNLTSADNQIYSGDVATAHTAGKAGLTLEIRQELQECGFPVPDNVDAIIQQVRDLRAAAPTDEPAPEETTTP
jgi:flagellar basal body-associated protein FliL